MHYVYVLKSLNKKWHYIGMAQDVSQRLGKHNAGRVKSTKSHRPFKLVYQEAYPTRVEARKREKYLKNTAKAREKIYSKVDQGPIV